MGRSGTKPAQKRVERWPFAVSASVEATEGAGLDFARRWRSRDVRITSMQTLLEVITRRVPRLGLIASLALINGAVVCRGQNVGPKPVASGPTQEALAVGTEVILTSTGPPPTNREQAARTKIQPPLWIEQHRR